MKPVQLGTILEENDETTAIYEKYPDWFDIQKESKWLTKYVVSKEPSADLIAEIEAYYAAIKECNRKHDDFVDWAANDVLTKLDNKEKEYIFLHPDSTTHHFGLGMWVRNNYIHGKELDFEFWHPDDLSSDITMRLASLIIENYDYDNPFYQYLYENWEFNRLRRQYFALKGVYPDELMVRFADRPDERQAAEEVQKKVRKEILNLNRFRRLCKEYQFPDDKQQEFVKCVKKLNAKGRVSVMTVVPYDVGLLASTSLKPELREKLLLLLQITLSQASDVALELPAFVFNQKDAVLLAVGAKGKALKRFKKFNADDDVIRAALSNDGEAIQYVRKDLRDDPDYIRIALSDEKAAALKMRCMSKYQDNENIVRIALEANGRNIEFTSPRLQDDLEIAKFAVTHQKDWFPYSTVCNLSPRLRDSLEIALLDIHEGQVCVSSYSERLRDSEEVAEALIETGNKWRLYLMSKRIQEKYKDSDESASEN